MLLRDLYKVLVIGQKIKIYEMNIGKTNLLHSGKSDNIPLNLIDRQVLLVRTSYDNKYTIDIVVDEEGV